MGKMLNLEVGGFYKIKCSSGGEYTGQIRCKTVHSKRTHSYLIAWPDIKHRMSSIPTGIYIWDYGWANQGFDALSMLNPITSCRKLSKEERQKIIDQFEDLGQIVLKA